MTDITKESLQKKQEAIDLLTRRYRGMEQRTEDIDLRLRLYFEDLLEHSSAKEDDDNDWHGIYELLGAAKFLRMLDTYNFNTRKVQTLFQKRNPNISAKDIADLIQRMVIPVSQTSMTQNPRIGEMEEKMLGKDEWMHFSDNPLWPWCFGNAAVESKGDPPIRRVVKGNGHSGKIDPIHGLLDALYCFDLSENRVSE